MQISMYPAPRCDTVFQEMEMEKELELSATFGAKFKLSKVGSSAGKKFACNAGDLNLIPGWEDSLEKGIGYPL